MDELDYTFMGFAVGVIMAIVIFLFLFFPNDQAHAEFVCESHDLDLIDYEMKDSTFSKVECGIDKTKETTIENYKVFTAGDN